jgi:DNA polymerase I
MSLDPFADLESDDNEIVDLDLDTEGDIKAEANDLIALIDADTLAFAGCLNCEQQEPLLPREMYSDNEWGEIISNPNYDANTDSIWTLNMNEALENCIMRIQRIYDKTGTRECELHFTAGRECFRYEVADSYKANRKGRPPTDLGKLKVELNKLYKGSICREIEADDIVVYLKNLHPEKYLMVAVDKDLLYSVVGTHFNYYESIQHEIDMKYVTVDADTAMKWAYKQCLMGDSVDGIKGCKGVGKVGANNAIDPCTTDLECWEAVVNLYEAKGMSIIDAITNMRLVNMYQYDGEKVVLWMPPKELII